MLSRLFRYLFSFNGMSYVGTIPVGACRGGLMTMSDTSLVCASPILLLFPPLWLMLKSPGTMLIVSLLVCGLVCPAHQFCWFKRLLIRNGQPLPVWLDTFLVWRYRQLALRRNSPQRSTYFLLWLATFTMAFTGLTSVLLLVNYYTGWPSP